MSQIRTMSLRHHEKHNCLFANSLLVSTFQSSPSIKVYVQGRQETTRVAPTLRVRDIHDSDGHAPGKDVHGRQWKRAPPAGTSRAL